VKLVAHARVKDIIRDLKPLNFYLSHRRVTAA